MVLPLPREVTMLLWRPNSRQGWSDIRPSDVFRCDVLSQAQNSLTWILDLSFGALLGGGNARSLLDVISTEALFLSEHIHYDRIHNNIKRGHLYALVISAALVITQGRVIFSFKER